MPATRSSLGKKVRRTAQRHPTPPTDSHCVVVHLHFRVAGDGNHPEVLKPILRQSQPLNHLGINVGFVPPAIQFRFDSQGDMVRHVREIADRVVSSSGGVVVKDR